MRFTYTELKKVDGKIRDVIVPRRRGFCKVRNPGVRPFTARANRTLALSQRGRPEGPRR